MQQNLPYEPDSRLAGQEIPSRLWNLNFDYYRVHKSTSSDFTLSQLNADHHILTLVSLKTNLFGIASNNTERSVQATLLLSDLMSPCQEAQNISGISPRLALIKNLGGLAWGMPCLLLSGNVKIKSAKL
jgi:hypothetical protein